MCGDLKPGKCARRKPIMIRWTIQPEAALRHLERTGNGWRCILARIRAGKDWCGDGMETIVQPHVLARGRDDDPLGAGGDVLGGIVALGELAGRFEHDIHAEVLPGQLPGVLD